MRPRYGGVFYAATSNGPAGHQLGINLLGFTSVTISRSGAVGRREAAWAISCLEAPQSKSLTIE